MKKSFVIALVAMFVSGSVYAQQTPETTMQKMKDRAEVMKANRKSMSAKVSKEVKKQAKQMTKEGWKVMPGQLPREQQLERSVLFMNQFEDDLITPKYVWGDATSQAEFYDAGKIQALELARLNLAGSLEQRITQIVDNNVGNDQKAMQQAASLTKTLKKAKGIISTRLGQTTPVVEAYRELKNGNIEVRVQTFYSMDKAREMVREGIRQQMEQDGEKLTPELEKLLGK